MFRTLAILVVLTVSHGNAEVLDRIAVAVGNRAVKESQIDRDVRLTAFLNGTRLDLSAAAKRKAAERLVDQTLIRAEISKGSFPAASQAEVANVFGKIEQVRFRNRTEYAAALREYGITEEELKLHIAWQLAVLRFIDLRFEPAVRAQNVRTAKPRPLGDRVNDAFFAWLEEARKHVRIQFHDEVFQ